VKKKQDKQWFYALEVHVAPLTGMKQDGDNNTILPGGCVLQHKYRIYSHYGSVHDALVSLHQFKAAISFFSQQHYRGTML
jgi:hypothetical protein